jgi:cardiolipin synthase C
MQRTFTGGVALLAAMLAAACATLPPPGERTESHAIEPDARTRLGIAVAPLAAAHPGNSGIHPLTVATDAFAARVVLAAAAERSLDVQYYIWHADETGVLLLQALHNAAARGVRVRLLVDDQNTSGTEPLLAALAARPNVEVRLYNPFANRSLRALGYLGDFERLNRRMHNKSFTADNQVAIVGGRNIGNEYFGAGSEVPFKDLDVMAIGAVVPEVSAEFDLYWNSASAYPISSVVQPAGQEEASLFAERAAAVNASTEAQAYLAAVRATPLIPQLLDRSLEIEWAPAHVVRDDPAKTLDPEAGKEVLLLTQLMEGQSRPQRSLDIISPYFVPGERGAAQLEKLARDGVRVRVLTNSLAATDVAVVHSGYAKRRCALARAGVRLFELKPVFEDVQARKKDKPDSGSSAASLHAKTFAADESRIFVGSFNFDLRSALLNTEMGLVMASPPLAARLSKAFDEVIAPNAYEIRASPGEPCVTWVERKDGAEVVHDTEPGSSWLRRAWLSVLMALPLDWML